MQDGPLPGLTIAVLRQCYNTFITLDAVPIELRFSSFSHQLRNCCSNQSDKAHDEHRSGLLFFFHAKGARACMESMGGLMSYRRHAPRICLSLLESWSSLVALLLRIGMRFDSKFSTKPCQYVLCLPTDVLITYAQSRESFQGCFHILLVFPFRISVCLMSSLPVPPVASREKLNNTRSETRKLRA